MARATGIKICGIDTLANAQQAVSLGVDAIGLVFAPGSARVLEVSQAAAIAQAVAGKITRVGMFVDPATTAVERILDAVALDVLQFHGDEPASFCAQFGKPYYKALRAGQDSAHSLAQRHPDAVGWLLDTDIGGHFGGTGEAFDWALWPSAIQRQQSTGGAWILAGGLDARTVGAAVAALRPDMVDVSSGVEGARKGVKDPVKMSEFVAAVRAADAQLARAPAESKNIDPHSIAPARNP